MVAEVSRLILHLWRFPSFRALPRPISRPHPQPNRPTRNASTPISITVRGSAPGAAAPQRSHL